MSEKSGFELRALDLSELKTHRSEKWRSFPADVLPLPVAEMDFPVAEPIRRILREMVDTSDLGYLGPIPELGRAFSGFAERRWGWKADAAQVRIAADVGVGVVEVLRVITQPGDKILINSPVYPNFWTWCAETKLEQVDVPFSQAPEEVDGSHWHLDWDGIEKAYASGIKAHLISNPHNPLGKVFTRQELTRFADLAKKYGVYVLSDEIHAPLTFSEQVFTPFLAISDAAREVGITITSSSKGWNIAGLKCAIIVTENEKLHEKLNAIAPATHYRASLLGGFASVAAFEEGEPWLDTVAGDKQLGHVFNRWHLQPNTTYARSNRRKHVDLRWCAKNPKGAGRWLFEGLEQHVRCRLRHAVGIFDDHDAKTTNR